VDENKSATTLWSFSPLAVYSLNFVAMVFGRRTKCWVALLTIYRWQRVNFNYVSLKTYCTCKPKCILKKERHKQKMFDNTISKMPSCSYITYHKKFIHQNRKNFKTLWSSRLTYSRCAGHIILQMQYTGHRLLHKSIWSDVCGSRDAMLGPLSKLPTS